MKIFCAYAFTGEDLETTTARMKMVVESLERAGHTAYCNLFDPSVKIMQARDDYQAIFNRAFDVIEQNEAVVAIISSPNRSVGQIMEIGVALSKHIPLYVFEHSSANGTNYLPKLSNQHFVYRSDEELKVLLSKL